MPEDVVALKALFSKAGVIGPPPGLFSQLLDFNIAFSELWETPAPAQATLRQRFDDAVFPAGVVLGPPQSMWPVYPHDEYWGKYAETASRPARRTRRASRSSAGGVTRM